MSVCLQSQRVINREILKKVLFFSLTLIAKESAPSFGTVTLPWLLTSTMLTSRVRDTQVAVFTLVTNIAPDEQY